MGKTHTGHAISMPAGVLLGALYSIITTAVGCALLSWLVLSAWVQEKMIGYGIMFILLLAIIIGSSTAIHKVKRKYLSVSLLTGAVYFLFLLASNALLFGAHYTGVGVTALLIAAGSITVSMAAVSRRNAKGIRKFGRRNFFSG